MVHHDQIVYLQIEFFISQDPSGVSAHMLTLNIGVHIILLPNLNRPYLCYGIQLIIQNLLQTLIEPTPLTDKFRGEDVLIPRIPIVSMGTPFELNVVIPMKNHMWLVHMLENPWIYSAPDGKTNKYCIPKSEQISRISQQIL